MRARPFRAAVPLQAARRVDNRIARHSVIIRLVHIVCPFVDLVRPRLDGPGPLARVFDIGDAPGTEHPHNLLHRHIAQILSHKQVYEIVDIGQMSTVERISRDDAIKPPRLDLSANTIHIAGIRIQTVHQIALAGVELGRLHPITTAEMNDEAATNS